MSRIRRIFPGGNTANGFCSFHDNIISEDRKQLYIFKGMPGGGKSSLMKDMADKMIEKGYSIEYHHCPSDPSSVDAIVIEELKISLLDGTAPHNIDPTYPGITDKIIDLAQFIDKDKIVGKKEDIVKAKKNNKIAYKRAFNYFKAAKVIYEGIVDDNKRMIDIKGLNNETINLIESVFSKEPMAISSSGFKERHLFSTAYTPEGFVDYTDTILRWIPDIYYINGEIGTGKSMLLDRLLVESRIRNYEVEIYHNALIPEKIESLYIKELDTIITSNKHGEVKGKTIIDLNKYLDSNNINKEDMNMFNLLVEKGVIDLNGAKENHFILEKSYRPSVDFSRVNKIKEEIYNEILTYIK